MEEAGFKEVQLELACDLNHEMEGHINVRAGLGGRGGRALVIGFGMILAHEI